MSSADLSSKSNSNNQLAAAPLTKLSCFASGYRQGDLRLLGFLQRTSSASIPVSRHQIPSLHRFDELRCTGQTIDVDYSP